MGLVKIKAGALQLTVFIIVIIALLLGAFLVGVNTFQVFKLKTNLVSETVKNVNIGFEFAERNTLTIGDTLTFDLGEDKYVNVSMDLWGAFHKVHVKSKVKTFEVDKIGLLGAKRSSEKAEALYLEDRNRPLVLVGQTNIKGAAFIPEQGVRTGHISGESYYGTELIYGSSEIIKTFPSVSRLFTNYLRHVENLYEGEESSQFIAWKNESKIENSFLNRFKVIFEKGTIALNNIVLSGHIVVQSKLKIVVESSAILNDVLLIAPEIVIKSGVKGRFQVVAIEHISVGSGCELDYPSALILNKANTSQQDEDMKSDFKIEIDEYSKISGIVAFLDASGIKYYKPQIELGKASVITGELFCQGNLELSGIVNGTVYTSQFLVKKGGSVYQNHVYNAIINGEELMPEYAGLLLEDRDKVVAKWLY